MKHIISPNRAKAQSGNVLVAALGVIGIIAVVGVSAYGLIHGPIFSAATVAKRSKAQADLVVVARMLIKASTDTDADSVVEPPAFDATVTPRIKNAANADSGGGIPASIGGAKIDAWGTPFGYCVWDHGATTNGANMLAGAVANYGQKLLLAVVSAGANHVFETTCDPDATGYLTEGVTSDDMIERYTFEQAAATGLWEKYSATDKIQYDAGSVLIGAAVGSAEFQVDGDAEIGGKLGVGGDGIFNKLAVGDNLSTGVLDFNSGSMTTSHVSGITADSLAIANPTTKVDNLKSNLLDDQAADYYLDITNVTNLPSQVDPNDFDAFEENNADSLFFSRTNATTLAVRVDKLNGIKTPDYAPSDGNMLYYNPLYNGGSWTYYRPDYQGDMDSNPDGEPTVKVIGIQGRSVTSTAPTANKVLGWNGTAWAPMSVVYGAGDVNNVGIGSGVNFLGTGSLITAGNCPSGRVPKYSGTVWQCRVDYGLRYTLPLDADGAPSTKTIVSIAANADWLMNFGLPSAGLTNNTLVGYRAGDSINFTTGGGGSVMLGYEAGRWVTTGHSSVYVGRDAGKSANTGLRNTIFGTYAGDSLTGTDNAIIVGHGAASGSTSAYQSIVMGHTAGSVVTTNPAQIMIGFGAGFNYPRSNNVLIGRAAGVGLNGTNAGEAFRNIMIGSTAGNSARKTNDSLFIGYNVLSASGTCGYDNDGASDNVYIGVSIAVNTTTCSTGGANVGIGRNMMDKNTTAWGNVFIGDSVATDNAAGIKNVAIGYQAARGLDALNDSIFIGYLTGRSNGATGANQTIAIGSNAMGSNVQIVSNHNIVIGVDAGNVMRTSTGNIVVGASAGYGLTTGQRNVLLGDCAACGLTSGSDNVIIGQRMGAPSGGNIFTPTWADAVESNVLTSGNGNILIGRGTGVPANNSSDRFYLSTSRAHHVLWGPMTTGNWTIKGTLTQLSDKRLKRDIRPIAHASDKLKKLHAIIFKWKKWYNGDDRDYLGLKAQEVEKIVPEVVFQNGKGKMEKYMSVSYGQLVPLLIEDMKARQKRIDTLKAKIAEFKAEDKK